jgi:hypothetical protein
MSTSDVVAIVAAVVVAVLSGALVVALLALTAALRSLRAATDLLREETLPVVAELHRAVADTVEEVERVDRLITAAEGIGDRVDGASRLAYRAIGSPVVKAMAFGAGVSQATRRLRGRTDEQPVPATGSRAAAKAPRHRRRRGGGA